jgi:Arc/MetJ-type ribon-helix-helix transcriptional regulator
MSTVSVPLNSELDEGLTWLVTSGKAENRAQAMRKALAQYIEDEAVNDVLEARKQPRLEGDLDELAKMIK